MKSTLYKFKLIVEIIWKNVKLSCKFNYQMTARNAQQKLQWETTQERSGFSLKNTDVTNIDYAKRKYNSFVIPKMEVLYL